MFWIGVQQCFFLRVGSKSSTAVSRDGSGRSERVGAVPPVVEELRVKASKPSNHEKKKKEKDEEESLIICCFCLFFVLTVAGQTFFSLSTLLTPCLWMNFPSAPSRRPTRPITPIFKASCFAKSRSGCGVAVVGGEPSAWRQEADIFGDFVRACFCCSFLCAWADLDVSREDDVTLFLLMLQNGSLFDEE